MTYGWVDTAFLAWWRPDSAIVTPESYALFAKAVFLEDWDWSYGKAEVKAG